MRMPATFRSRLLSIGATFPAIRRRIFFARELGAAIEPTAAGHVVAQERTPFVAPLPPDESGILRFARGRPASVEYPRATIVELTDADVKTEAGIVLHHGRLVWWDAERGFADANLEKFSTRFSPRLLEHPVPVAGTALCLVHTNPSNYYHFLLDLSIQLQVCRMLQHEPERVVLIGGVHDWQSDALGAYGYSGERVLAVRGAANLHFERLWLVRQANMKLDLRDNVWLYRPDVLAAHRATLVDAFAPGARTASRRLYVTRGAGFRHLGNEEEVLDLLVPAGFEVVDPGALSLAEQIDAFRSAEAVVGAHGAGLTNLLFAEPGGRVAEILAADWSSPCYAHLSALRGLDYVPLIGGGLEGESYTAPLGELQRWVEALPQPSSASTSATSAASSMSSEASGSIT